MRVLNMQRPVRANLDSGRVVDLRRGANAIEDDELFEELAGHWFVQANLAPEPKVLGAPEAAPPAEPQNEGDDDLQSTGNARAPAPGKKRK